MKSEFEVYMETGILGSYMPERAIGFRDENILLQNPHELLSSLLRTMTHIRPVAYLLCVKLADGHFLADRVYPVVKVFLDFFLFFSKRNIFPFSCRGLVGGY